MKDHCHPPLFTRKLPVYPLFFPNGGPSASGPWQRHAYTINGGRGVLTIFFEVDEFAYLSNS